MSGKVLVLSGGPSPEREISLQSGAAVLRALEKSGRPAVAWEPVLDAGLPRRLSEQECASAFVAVHGAGGEDGILQLALELAGIPYTGSPVAASALAWDKLLCKKVWQGCGLPTPEGELLKDRSAGADFLAACGELAVKPNHGGSSFGITHVRAAGELPAAFDAAAKFGAEVLAERWVGGKEYTVGILEDRALPVVLVEVENDFYDYEAKYADSGTRLRVPSGLPAAREEELKELALAAFAALGCRGWGRVDFMLDGGGAPYLLELNTVPGLTDHSLLPAAARAEGIGFEELVLRILATAGEERPCPR